MDSYSARWDTAHQTHWYVFHKTKIWSVGLTKVVTVNNIQYITHTLFNVCFVVLSLIVDFLPAFVCLFCFCRWRVCPVSTSLTQLSHSGICLWSFQSDITAPTKAQALQLTSAAAPSLRCCPSLQRWRLLKAASMPATTATVSAMFTSM